MSAATGKSAAVAPTSTRLVGGMQMLKLGREPVSLHLESGAASGKPFFAYVAFQANHVPVQAPQAFIDKHPNTVQAMANAMVRANQWIQQAGPSDIINAVPEAFLLGDRAVYIDAFLAAKGALSPDGMIPEAGSTTAFRALASVDDKIAAAKLDLQAVYTNHFVKKANAKFKKA